MGEQGSLEMKRWELVGDIGDDEMGEQALQQMKTWEQAAQEWRATGLKLAELVVAKAMEIAAGGNARLTEGGGWDGKAWEPTAALQEAGYYDSDGAES